MISLFFSLFIVCEKWLLNVLFMKILRRTQLYSKSNLVIQHIDKLCVLLRKDTTKQITLHTNVSARSLIALQMRQIENGIQMGFRTVHYLDCLLRAELWKYSVRAVMKLVLYGQKKLPSAVALRTTDGVERQCNVEVLFLIVACSRMNLHG